MMDREAFMQRLMHDAEFRYAFEQGRADGRNDADKGWYEARIRGEILDAVAPGWREGGDRERMEALAGAAERRRIAFLVQALDHTVVMGGRGFGTIHEPTRDAVLALLK